MRPVWHQQETEINAGIAEHAKRGFATVVRTSTGVAEIVAVRVNCYNDGLEAKTTDGRWVPCTAYQRRRIK
jgi:hypothetical protein